MAALALTAIDACNCKSKVCLKGGLWGVATCVASYALRLRAYEATHVATGAVLVQASDNLAFLVLQPCRQDPGRVGRVANINTGARGKTRAANNKSTTVGTMTAAGRRLSGGVLQGGAKVGKTDATA